MLDKNGKTLFLQEQFPERLKKLRTEHNLSQQKLADIIGISKGALGFYEIGKNSPDILTLTAFAQYFGVSADYLLGLSDNRTTDTNLQEVTNYTSLSEKAIDNLTHFKDMPEKEFFENYGRSATTLELATPQNVLSDFFETENLSNLILSIYRYFEDYLSSCLSYNISNTKFGKNKIINDMNYSKWLLGQDFLNCINCFGKNIKDKYLLEITNQPQSH